MTQPPHEPPPSIYTRLDGSPLPQRTPLAPAPPVMPAGLPQPSAWPGAHAAAYPMAARQQFVLATWGSRLGAFLMDAFLFGITAWLVMLPVGVALGLTVNEAAAFFARLIPLPESIVDPTPFYVALAIQAMIPGIALAVALLRMEGQTPGKRAMGIRVVRADGQPVDSRTAFRREVGAKTIVVGLLAIFTLGIGWLLNFLWPLWDREHRAGHDMLAGTRVVQAPKTPPTGRSWHA